MQKPELNEIVLLLRRVEYLVNTSRAPSLQSLYREFVITDEPNTLFKMEYEDVNTPEAFLKNYRK